jgi:hypothetical protein
VDLTFRYYEDLTCPSFDQVILERLENGEKVTLAIGKLIERLLTLKMAREGISVDPREIYFTWDWEAHPEGPGETYTTNKVDELKAPFLDHLIQIADNYINQIRYV